MKRILPVEGRIPCVNFGKTFFTLLCYDTDCVSYPHCSEETESEGRRHTYLDSEYMPLFLVVKGQVGIQLLRLAPVLDRSFSRLHEEKGIGRT